MSMLVTGFTTWMRKKAMGLEGEATFSSGGKWSRRSPLDDGA